MALQTKQIWIKMYNEVIQKKAKNAVCTNKYGTNCIHSINLLLSCSIFLSLDLKFQSAEPKKYVDVFSMNKKHKDVVRTHKFLRCKYSKWTFYDESYGGHQLMQRLQPLHTAPAQATCVSQCVPYWIAQCLLQILPNSTTRQFMFEQRVTCWDLSSCTQHSINSYISSIKIHR